MQWTGSSNRSCTYKQTCWTPAQRAFKQRSSRGLQCWAAVTKKGVGTFPWSKEDAKINDSGKMKDMGITWVYSWSSSIWHRGSGNWEVPGDSLWGQQNSYVLSTKTPPNPKGIQYVPMIWGPAYLSQHDMNIAEWGAHEYGSGTVLGFNEPDHEDQSNMSVADVIRHWPQLEAISGVKLGSPATAGDATTGWFADFWDQAMAKGYRIDFICVHWYGDDLDQPDKMVDKLVGHLKAVNRKYGKNIWLTEFALLKYIEVSHGVYKTVFPSDENQKEFAAKAVAELEKLTFVERYAWFALPRSSTDAKANNHLVNENLTLTKAGEGYSH